MDDIEKKALQIINTASAKEQLLLLTTDIAEFSKGGLVIAGGGNEAGTFIICPKDSSSDILNIVVNIIATVLDSGNYDENIFFNNLRRWVQDTRRGKE